VPYQYEVLQDGSLVYTRITGLMTHDDSLAHHRRVAVDPAIRPGFSEIYDGRHISGAEVDEKTIHEIAEIDRQAGPKMVGGKVAVVASGALAFKLQYAYPSQGPRRVIVFSDLETAARWLGIESLQDVLGTG
jgi:hypothetical protein